MTRLPSIRNFPLLGVLGVSSTLTCMQSLAALTLSFLLASQLSREDFGLYTYAMIFSAVVAVIAPLGTDRTLVRDLSRSEKPHEIQTKNTSIRICSAFVMLCLVGSSAVALKGLSAESIAIVLGSMYGTLLALQPIAWLDYKGRFRAQSALQLAERVLCLALICWLYSTLDPTVVIALVALIFVRSLTLIVQFAMCGTKLSWRHLAPRMLYETSKDNWPIIATIVGNLCISHVNQIRLEKTSGLGEVATFGIAMQFISIGQIIQGQFSRIMASDIALATAKPDTMQVAFSGMHKHLMAAGAISFIVSAATVGIAYPIVIGVLGEAYRGSLATLIVLATWSTITGIGMIINQYALGYSLHLKCMYASCFGGAIAIILGMSPLLSSMGAMGAAIALLFGHSASIAMQYLSVMKYTRGLLC